MQTTTSGDWRFDYASRQWLYYNNTTRCWCNQSGQAVRSPQWESSIAGSSTQNPNVMSPQGTNTSRTPAGNVGQTTGLEGAMADMAVQPSNRGDTQGPRATTAKDPITGVETSWEIGTSTQDAINYKRVRERSTTAIEGYGISDSPRTEYRDGRVIEVLLVPPSSTTASNVSRFTPYEAPQSRASIRLRRFVIINDNMPGGNTFEAIPIKTYNGEGVAQRGVVKSRHGIIYTGQEPKRKSDETPGRDEEGMQSTAIRVIPYDKATALDKISRLDYGDRYRFDHRVPNIKIFGRVHENSEPSLYTQLHLVFNAIEKAARTPSAGTSKPSVAAATGSSSKTPAAGSSTTIVPRRRTGLTTTRRLGLAKISDQDMWAILQTYMAYAREHNHSMRTQWNREAIHELAQDPRKRVESLEAQKRLFGLSAEDSDSE